MQHGTGRLPRQFLAVFTRRAFAVRAQARTAEGAIFVREAVVEFVATSAAAFQIRRWYRGSAAMPGTAATPEELPPC